jgi:hypothetical protein
VVRGIDIIAMIMDVSDLARLYNTVLAHRDIYVIGTIIGKFAKLLSQAYMSGVLDHLVNFILFFVAPDL